MDQFLNAGQDGQTREINAASIKYLAGTHCNLQRFDNRSNSLRPTDLPDTIASLLVTRAGHGVFPRLNGVISAPTMTPSGRLIDQPGFDEGTGLLYLTKGDIQLPTIDARPNAAALQEAFRQLWFPFKDFPFDSDSSKSTMVAGLLTSVVRACLPTAPGFGLDAPTAGAGKTKLAQCIAALGTGEVEALLPPPSDDDETRKKISTAVLASKPVIIFDNVEAQLKSPVLAAFLTAPVWSDRMLGANAQINADNRMLLLVTGNNLSPVGDIVRRLLTIRIDPRLESSQVWQREFELDPLDYVIRNRLRMIAAALTLLSGFISAGRPRLVTGRLASFEHWDDLVRQCVVWLGSQGIGALIDPVERLTVAAENDPETTRFSALASAWFAAFSSEPKQLKDIIHSGQLSEVLRDVVECRGVINAKLLGAYLRKRLGKIVDGFRFEKIAGRSNTALWRVVRLVVDGGGFGGCGGLASGHPTNNEISSTSIFGEVGETDPPHPSNPPTGIPKPNQPPLSSMTQELAYDPCC